jgi:hypothetical protein
VLSQILVVPITAPEEAPYRALHDRPQPIMQRCRSVRVARTDRRQQLAVIEGRGREPVL